jgi:hypothetical protein
MTKRIRQSESKGRHERRRLEKQESSCDILGGKRRNRSWSIDHALDAVVDHVDAITSSDPDRYVSYVKFGNPLSRFLL